LFLQVRSEFSLCRLYTKSGYERQFDRRPSAAAAAGGGSENPVVSSSAAASLADVEETGQKRKRSSQNDDTFSSDDGDGGRGCNSQQWPAAQEAGTEEGIVNGADEWAEYLDWF
jgi:hypothetical protein